MRQPKLWPIARTWLSCLALVLLAACAGLPGGLEPPDVTIVGMTGEARPGLFEQDVDVRIAVDNPNDRQLSVSSLRYTMDLNGRTIGRGYTTESFVVDAYGRAEAGGRLKLGTDAMIGALVNMAERPQLDFRLRGSMKVKEAPFGSLGFDREGSLDFSQFEALGGAAR
ncbi:MAG: LEA type 2 family protein [Geminicoccaceae bacterium]